MGKHLCQSLFFYKVDYGRFPRNFAKFLRTPFSYRTPPVAASANTKLKTSKPRKNTPPLNWQLPKCK